MESGFQMHITAQNRMTRDQCYKTLFVRNLWIFVTSKGKAGAYQSGAPERQAHGLTRKH
jgi:hypothetical protein